MNKTNVLITGSTGFIGSELFNIVSAKKYGCIAIVRRPTSIFPSYIQQIKIADISPITDWIKILNAIDVVIHLAARVHVMHDTVSDPLAEFRSNNLDATLNLARQAAGAGVKRFIYLSSIKSNGEWTEPNKPFTETDTFIPDDPYALSKYEAEQALLELSQTTGMEVVIIRPPLVYGPGVKANFASMVKWVERGIPLPLGAIHNCRSLVALDNLVNFIIHCIDHPKAANEIFLISDGEDLSTTQLLQKVAKAYGKPSRLIPVPVSWMTFAAKLLGKEEVARRLFGNLQIDSSKARNLLGWQPMVTMDEQLAKMASLQTQNQSK